MIDTLRDAGLALFPAGEQGSDPGGAVVGVLRPEQNGVSVGWFTSDALTDRHDSDPEFIHACEAAMVNAMAGILVAPGLSVSLCPWEVDGDEGGLSIFVPSEQRKLGT